MNQQIIKPLGDGKRKILSLDEAMRQIDDHQPSEPQTPQENKTTDEAIVTQPISYLSLEWEPNICDCKPDRNEGFTYDESLARLQAAGYERHPQPAELFSLIMAYLEGDFATNPDLHMLAEKILKRPGCWLSMAMRRSGDTIMCFVDPKNLRYDEDADKYVFGKGTSDKMKLGHIRTFSVIGMPSETEVELRVLNVLNPKLVKFLYSRDLDCFPAEMFENGLCVPKLTFPAEKNLWPVAYGGFSMDWVYSMNMADPNSFPNAPSLGVREKK